jgi:hypothetical protein
MQDDGSPGRYDGGRDAREQEGAQAYDSFSGAERIMKRV